MDNSQALKALEQFEKNYDNKDYVGNKKALKKNQYGLEKISWLHQRGCRNFAYFDNPRLLSIGKIFIKILDKFEENKTDFEALTSDNLVKLDTLKLKIRLLLAKVEGKENLKIVQSINAQIAWRIHSLQDKKKLSNKKNQKNPEQLPATILDHINKWHIKNKSNLEDGTSLRRTPENVKINLEKIKKNLLQHASFVALMEKYPNILYLLLDWVIRDGLDSKEHLQIFMNMPTSYQWLKKYFLPARVANFQENMKIIENQVNLNCGKTWVYIHQNESEKKLNFEYENIHLNGENTTIKCDTTWKRIKKEFKNKGEQAGDFEFFEQGITPFNTYKNAWYLGDDEKGKRRYDPINFQNEDWIKSMPVAQYITEEEVTHKYKGNNAQNILATHISCHDAQKPREVMKTHAWMEYYQKSGKNLHQTYHWGSYSEKYPTTTLGRLFFVGGTAVGVVTGFDEGSLYNFRPNKIIDVSELTEEKKILYLKTMGVFFHAAQNGKWAFQFLFHACSYLVVQAFTKVFPEKKDYFEDLFLSNITELDPEGSVGYISGILSMAPKGMRGVIFLFLTLLFQGWKGVRVVDINNEGQEVHISLLRKALSCLWSGEITTYFTGKQFTLAKEV